MTYGFFSDIVLMNLYYVRRHNPYLCVVKTLEQRNSALFHLSDHLYCPSSRHVSTTLYSTTAVLLRQITFWLHNLTKKLVC